MMGGTGLTPTKFMQFVFCTGLLVGGSYVGVQGFTTMMVVVIFSGLAGILWVIVDSLWDQHNNGISERTRLVRSRKTFAATIASTDKDTRHFLAREWPEMGVEFGEDALMYILKDGVNTHVLVPFLRAFLMDSTENAFVEERRYNDQKFLQERLNVSREAVRRQWKFATDLLVSEGYLRPETMGGNQTYKWTTHEHFKKMRRRYLNIPNLQEM